MWECDWRRTKSKQKLSNRIQSFSNDFLLTPGMPITEDAPTLFPLYKKVSGTEKIHYIDVVSMYPTVMSLPKYWYPIGQHEVRRFDDPENASFYHSISLFGLQKCKVVPPNNLFHPVLPETK
jgi:hypothetical protein